ncbi:MAG: hypothetical protein ABIA92_06050 [Patescibacteria group bacterium]
MLKLFLLLTVLLLSACTPVAQKPFINFIGISSGTLATNLDELEFTDSFDVIQRNIVAVISFSEVAAGTNVQATWFTPDDRRMPLGRKNIIVESGATIARFSLASKEDWTPAPFMLDIRAQSGEGETAKTASGQIHFFIGMTDTQKDEYKEEFSAWKEHEEIKRKEYERKQQQENQLLLGVQTHLNAPEAGIGFRYDLIGDTDEELIIIDPMPEEPFFGATATGAVFSADVDQISIIDQSGSTIFSLKQEGGDHLVYGMQGPLGASVNTNEQVHTDVFEDAIVIEWKEKKVTCTQRFTLKDDWVKEDEKVCE